MWYEGHHRDCNYKGMGDLIFRCVVTVGYVVTSKLFGDSWLGKKKKKNLMTAEKKTLFMAYVGTGVGESLGELTSEYFNRRPLWQFSLDVLQRYAVQGGQGNLRFSKVQLNRCVSAERAKIGLVFVNILRKGRCNRKDG